MGVSVSPHRPALPAKKRRHTDTSSATPDKILVRYVRACEVTERLRTTYLKISPSERGERVAAGVQCKLGVVDGHSLACRTAVGTDERADACQRMLDAAIDQAATLSGRQYH